MDNISKFEKYFYIFLIALGIFIVGVQFGIKHGRELQIQDIKEGYDEVNERQMQTRFAFARANEAKGGAL